jgi:Fe-S-cluster containining protein
MQKLDNSNLRMKYQKYLDKGIEIKESAIKAFSKLKSKKGKLDVIFHKEHVKAFQKIDCLGCANCCKTTSPIFRDIDVKRLSKDLRMTEKKFISEYLHQDEEDDYVLNFAPCPFLDLSDNKCTVYESRPAACRDYPHTDRKNMYQILDLTVKNIDVCPAVVQVVERIIEGASQPKR